MASAAGLAAGLEDGHSPLGHRTGSLAAVVVVAHPIANPSSQPWWRCDPALSTCCRSLLAGRKDTAFGAAAAASDGVPDALRRDQLRYPVAPCHAERSDRIESRRPFFQVIKTAGLQLTTNVRILIIINTTLTLNCRTDICAFLLTACSKRLAV